MYKFTNGVVVYDEITRDKYIKAGMTLIKEEPKKEEIEEIGDKEVNSEFKSNKFEKTNKRTGRFGRNFK